MEKITGDLSAVDHELIEGLFPNVPSWRLRRPYGPVDLLIGLGMSELHPYLENPRKMRIGVLRCLTSMFGNGYLIDGHHEKLTPRGGRICNLAYDYSQGKLSDVTTSRKKFFSNYVGSDESSAVESESEVVPEEVVSGTEAVTAEENDAGLIHSDEEEVSEARIDAAIEEARHRFVTLPLN